MNWSGAKNWLIVLFLAINIYLIFTLVNISSESSVIDKQTLHQTVELLHESGVSVDENIIPTYMPKIGTIEVNNVIDNKAAAARRILGDGVRAEGENIYTNGAEQVRFEGDYIYYKNNSDGQDAPEADIGSVRNYIINKFRDYGFDIETSSLYIEQRGSEYHMSAVQKFDRYLLLDSSFYIIADNGGIKEFSGSWFVLSSKQNNPASDSSRVRSVVSVLLDFLRDGERIDNNSNQITAIELGYKTGDKGVHHKQMTAMPIWQITCSDGRKYDFSAR